MLAEFDIIRRCFDRPGLAAPEDAVVRQGIGDDCALLSVPPGKSLAFSMDTLVAGVHFPDTADPAQLAARALAVNLSDLAACGAEPLVFTLSLTLPAADETWLAAFAGGLAKMAQAYRCPLVGGDISRGPLAITIQVHGLVPEGRAILRSGARPGDRLYVSGSLGRAGLALTLLSGDASAVPEAIRPTLLEAYYRPRPRLDIARRLAAHVSAGIDISDGLLGDLQHICERSGCGAVVRAAEVPVDAAVLEAAGRERALALALNAGDDYELILAVPPAREAAFLAAAQGQPVPLTCIGEMTAGDGVTCLDAAGLPLVMTGHSYTHFAESS